MEMSRMEMSSMYMVINFITETYRYLESKHHPRPGPDKSIQWMSESYKSWFYVQLPPCVSLSKNLKYKYIDQSAPMTDDLGGLATGYVKDGVAEIRGNKARYSDVLYIEYCVATFDERIRDKWM